MTAGTVPPGTGGKGSKAAKKGQGAKKKGGKGRKGKKGKRPRKQKKKHKCGDSGSYGHMKDNYTADGKERDHIPSCAALIHNAKTNVFSGRKLCPAQETAIVRAASACAIPKGVHEAYSKTFKNRNKATDSKGRKLYERDANRKKQAANRDTAAIKKGLKKKGASKQCRKAYTDWAKQVNGRTQKWYENMITKAVNSAK